MNSDRLRAAIDDVKFLLVMIPLAIFFGWCYLVKWAHWGRSP